MTARSRPSRRRILLTMLRRLGPPLLGVSRAHDADRPLAAVRHLRAARSAIDAALEALAGK